MGSEGLDNRTELGGLDTVQELSCSPDEGKYRTLEKLIHAVAILDIRIKLRT